MTNPWNQHDDDDWSDDFDDGSKSQKNPVRERMRKLEKENKELKEANEKALFQMRQNTIATALKDKGYSSKLAALIPSDVEPTVEALDKWLQDYADIFVPATTTTVTSDGGDDGEGSAEDNQYGQQMGRISDATTATQSALSNKDEVARELARKDLTHGELLSMIEKAGGGFGIG